MISWGSAENESTVDTHGVPRLGGPRCRHYSNYRMGYIRTPRRWTIRCRSAPSNRLHLTTACEIGDDIHGISRNHTRLPVSRWSSPRSKPQDKSQRLSFYLHIIYHSGNLDGDLGQVSRHPFHC